MADRHPASVLRTTTRITVGLAIAAICGGLLLGHFSLGILAAVGLVLGVLNMIVANSLFGESGAGFFATSGLRLVVLTLGAFAVFFLFKEAGAIAFVLGVSASQFCLSASAAAARVTG